MTDQEIRRTLFDALPTSDAVLQAFARGDATGVLNALVPVVARLVAQGQEAGRLSVMRELTAAVARFNDDDSMGIAQLIEVIQPWLDPDEPPLPAPPER